MASSVHSRLQTEALPLRLEPVPEAPQRCDVTASERSIDLLAQVADIDLDDVVVALVIESPHGVEDRLLRVNDAHPAHQELKQRELARGELDDRFATAAHASSSVQLEVADPEHGPRHLAAATQQSMDARDQHLIRERFGHVVVGAEVESAALTRLALSSGEHQDRRVDPGLA